MGELVGWFALVSSVVVAAIAAVDYTVGLVEKKISRAIEREREICADIADDVGAQINRSEVTAMEIARRIRRRST